MVFFRLLRPLVLASSSPRRREFLESLGLCAEICPAVCDEPRPEAGEDPVRFTRRCALFKARSAAALLHGKSGGAAVLSADTSVVCSDGESLRILGKPRDADDAFSMLSLLSGRTHSVVTACCLIWDGTEDVFHDQTEVAFCPWPSAVLMDYARSGDPLDKAGAYSIQGMGAFLVREIRGSWSTVVGLPLDMVVSRLLDAGIAVPS